MSKISAQRSRNSLPWRGTNGVPVTSRCSPAIARSARKETRRNGGASRLKSSKLLVDEFARLVLPLGTTAVVADPHEIANVLGTDGVHWLLDACDEVPLDVFVMASSCVPASRFESPRRELTTGDLEGLLRRRRVIGLAEMMNFPGVLHDDPDVMLPPSASADEALASARLPEHLQAALAALPDDFRAAVVLCDVAGWPYDEIADELGVPVGTVRSRIHRGRAQLRVAVLQLEQGEAADLARAAVDDLARCFGTDQMGVIWLGAVEVAALADVAEEAALREDQALVASLHERAAARVAALEAVYGDVLAAAADGRDRPGPEDAPCPRCATSPGTSASARSRSSTSRSPRPSTTSGRSARRRSR